MNLIHDLFLPYSYKKIPRKSRKSLRDFPEKNNLKIFLAFYFYCAIIILAFFRGLEKVPTFLVPIINPPFADNSPHKTPRGVLRRLIQPTPPASFTSSWKLDYGLGKWVLRLLIS
jgi:hypothetical protein